VQGDLVDPSVIEYRIGLIETSSVSSLILASMDAARREMALRGRELVDRALRLARRARSEIARIDGLEVMGREVIGRPGAHDLDETKIVIDVTGLGTNGYEACDWLRGEQRVLMELASRRHLLATVTIGDDDASVDRLVAGLRALAGRARGAGELPDVPHSSELRTELVQRPRDAYFGPAEHVPLDRSVGRIAGEKVTPYPPGVPVLVPGERITDPIVRYLKAGVSLGMNVTDVADPKLETVRVAA
jgi:lysine decarboxylase